MEEEMVLVVEGERVSNENQKGEMNKIWMHVCLFKLLDICIAILLWYSYFNNMYFVFRTIACTTGVDSSLGSLFCNLGSREYTLVFGNITTLYNSICIIDV